jgi:hypothetical protein
MGAETGEGESADGDYREWPRPCLFGGDDPVRIAGVDFEYDYEYDNDHELMTRAAQKRTPPWMN